MFKRQRFGNLRYKTFSAVSSSFADVAFLPWRYNHVAIWSYLMLTTFYYNEPEKHQGFAEHQ